MQTLECLFKSEEVMINKLIQFAKCRMNQSA